MRTKLFLASAGLIFFLVSASVSANLLIYPVRVAFDETERDAEITLTNTSSKINTYRLEWQEKSAKMEGGYQDLSENEAKSMPIASSMLRFSPREVTLKPNERQLIKLRLRRPRDLAEGEYRSHLLFKAIPSVADKGDETATRTQINIVMSFAIPVTIQQGKYDAQVSLQSAKIEYSKKDQSGKVTLGLSRQGQHSASGDISAFWTPTGGSEILLAKIADYNFWPELMEAEVSLISTDADFIPSDGRLRIKYEGVRDFKGISYLDKTIFIKQNEILLGK
jgi:fimbrial chaperone protein